MQNKSFFMYYPGQKNRYSRDIHEIDPHCNHVISCEIDFNLQRELATRRAAGRVDVEPKLDIARFHMIRLSDQPHEFLGCNDFFGQGSILRDHSRNPMYCLS